MKNVDLDEPTSFLDHVYLGRRQRLKNDQSGKSITQRRLRGPTIWKDMLKNALKDIANWQTKRRSNCTKSQVFAWMIIISRKRNVNQVGELSKVCSQIVFDILCTWHDLLELTFYCL